MDVFDALKLLGGLCLFLFGMNVMVQALERRAGGSLKALLGRMTTGKLAGLLTGLGITAIIQSSSATTVMVVGFVNSGLMSLKQAINVIMGANVGTTVTAWILSLAGIDSSNALVRLMKPASFVPVLALVGIVLYMFTKSSKKKDTGLILLGFATLMTGMETMSGAVSGLKSVPGFTQLFVLFKNPVSGVLAGAALTAVIQSSSASVGILQALSLTGAVSLGAAIPIIMGQNIGTCATALLSSIGAGKNAKRAALVHLCFNIIGTLVCLVIFALVRGCFTAALDSPATPFMIAVSHSVFNVFCTLMLLPASDLLERLVTVLIPDRTPPQKAPRLDERLFITPPIALERCAEVTGEMAGKAVNAVRDALKMLDGAEAIAGEAACDEYEDAINTYLVKLSALEIGAADSRRAAGLLRETGDLERLSDHAVGITRAAKELKDKGLSFSEEASGELKLLVSAVNEILDITLAAFENNDPAAADAVEPLKRVIEALKEQLRINHIDRLQRSRCSIELGFIWSDLLTDFERVAAHCANIADCVSGINDPHAASREQREHSPEYNEAFEHYNQKYALR